jgi:hypothetical protein
MSAFETHTHGGRITSLFGVMFPPKRKKVVRKHLTISFVIQGTIPSKKNMLYAASNLYFVLKNMTRCQTVPEAIEYLKENLKVYMQNSKKYNEWVDEQRPIIAEQSQFWHEKFKAQGLQYPLSGVSVKVYHYFNDNIERDLSNKLDSINDLLVKLGILENDDWKNVNKIASEGEGYKDEILRAITRIDVTKQF